MMMCLGTRSARWSLHLLHQLLAAVLAQQLLQHVEAHPLLDTAALLGIEVHVAAQVAHPVGEQPDHIALSTSMVTSPTPTASSRRASSLVSRWPSSNRSSPVAGLPRHRPAVARDWPAPQGQLLIELVPAHDAQIVPPGIEEQILHQGLAASSVGGSPGRSR